MRRAPLILLLSVVLSLCACGDRTAQRMLERAENVINETPSEAIALLDSIGDSGLSRSQRMHYKLLRAEAMNKTYQSMDTLSDMEQVADYYRPFLGRNHRYMRALYMLGCVYRDRNDAPMALHYYQEAVSQADTTDADCDFHTLCRVYGQMAVLYQRQRSPQLELEAERKAYVVALKAKDTIAAISYYEYMAGAYYALGKKDTSLAIVENSISQYTKMKERDLAAAEMGVAADFYIEKKDFKRADSLLKQYEAYSGFFDKDGEITPGRESYYYTKGLYYQGVQELDSAIYFYRKLLNPVFDIKDKEMGYKGLSSIYHKLGVTDSVFKYSTLYALANDSANIIHSADEITRMQALYNYNRLRKIAEEKSAEAKNAHFKSAILILALALMLLLLSIVVIYYRQKKKDFRESEKQLYDKLRKIEQGQKQRDSEAEAELRELRLLRNDVVLRLKENAQRANSNIPLKDWLSLQETIKEELPVFYSTICMVQGLRQEEINVCMLIRLQFKPKEICNITGLSPQVITNMRKRLLNKIFGKVEGGSRDFDYRISKIK